MKQLIYIFLLLLLMSCVSSSEKKENKNLTQELRIIKKIEEGHHKQEFLSRDNIKFDILLSFGGKERINGTITLATNSSCGLIEMNDGNKIYFLNDNVYYSPGMNENKVRFDAYTWSYFFLFPYKLSDEGTIWSGQEKVQMNGKWFDTQRLTFASGTGDAPDDWYQVYSDTSDFLVQVAAYIVTANKSVEKAEEDPHAIEYSDYQLIENIPIATNWNFYGWTKTEGLTDTLGNAMLSNFVFIPDNDSLYTPPSNFLSK